MRMEQEFKRAVVFGCACVITSRFTVSELEDYQLLLPEAMKLEGANRETVFRVELDDDGSPGCIEVDRIVYSRTKVPGGKATVTLLLDPAAEDKAELVRNRIGPALMRLDALENQMAEQVDKLQENIRAAADFLYLLG